MGKILRNGISYAGGGADGKSAYQTWLDLGNEGTEQDFIDSLGGGGSSLYVVTGSLDMENEENPVTLNQTYEEIKAAYDEGKTIVADILVAGEAQYIFNLLYILEDAIAFEWINSAAKVGGQINLMSDNTATFVMTSFESEETPENEVLYTSLEGSLEGVTTVIEIVNILLEEYRANGKIIRFENGSLDRTMLTDLPKDCGYLTVKVGGTDAVEVTFAYSSRGFTTMYYGYVNRSSDETLYRKVNWQQVLIDDDISSLNQTAPVLVFSRYQEDADGNWTTNIFNPQFNSLLGSLKGTASKPVRLYLSAYDDYNLNNAYVLQLSAFDSELITFFGVCNINNELTDVTITYKKTGGVVTITKEKHVDSKELDEIKKSVSDGKSAVAGAITAKGIDTAADAEFATMAENINKIKPKLIFEKTNLQATSGSTTTNFVYGNGVIVVYYDKTIFYSHDRGKTWNTSTLNTSSATGGSIIFAEKPSVFVANLTDVGVYVSYNGKDWQEELTLSNANTVTYNDANGCLIGTNTNGGGAGIFHSYDGTHWYPNTNYSSKKVANAQAAGGRFFAVIDSSTYTSLDGYNWTAISALSGKTISGIKYDQGVWLGQVGSSWYYSNDGTTWAVCSASIASATYGQAIQSFKRLNYNTWVASLYTGVYYSTDRGKNWTLSSTLGSSSGHWQFFTFNDKFYAISSGGPGTSIGGVYYTSNGNTWTATTGITSSGALSGSISILGNKCFMSTTANNGTVYKLNSDGTSWTQVLTGDSVVYKEKNILITKYGKYTLDGETWHQATLPDDIGDISFTRGHSCGSRISMSSSKAAYGYLCATLFE